MVTPIEEGDKVKAEITAILYKEQIKYIKENLKRMACGEFTIVYYILYTIQYILYSV